VLALAKIAEEEESGRSITSEQMAESVNAHPVHIRRVLGALRQAGLVQSQPGPGGGWRLARPPQKITLRDVYLALKTAPLLFLPEGGSQDCIASCFPTVLGQCFERAESAFETELERFTIADLIASARVEADALQAS
jgi:Rrf2 family protein